MDYPGGTLGFRGTSVENQCSTRICYPSVAVGFLRLCFCLDLCKQFRRPYCLGGGISVFVNIQNRSSEKTTISII